MTGYDCLPALLDHVPNSWERPAVPVLSIRAGARNSKTRIQEKEREKGGIKGGKTSYAECVWLTASEFEKLETRYGEKNAQRMVEKLSAYKLSKGKRYKSDYGAILNWVAGAVLGAKSAAVPEPVKPEECPECHVRGGNHGAFCSRQREG